MNHPADSRSVLAVLTLIAASACFLPAAEEAPFPTRIASPAWLHGNLGEPNLAVLDVRHDVKHYWQEHIPGAIFLAPDALTLTDHGVPAKLMPPDILARILGRLGITESTTVVVYSATADSLSPYLTWALDYVGHEHHALLEGGLDRWKVESLPLSQGFPKTSPVEYRLRAEMNESVLASLEDVRAARAKEDVILLDTRSPKAFAGEKGHWERNGHIPGAVNRPWKKDLRDDYTWRSAEELAPEYQALGVNRDKPVILSCGQGLRATHTYVTLKYILGYPDVKVYDGSFSEWTNATGTEVETGP